MARTSQLANMATSPGLTSYQGQSISADRELPHDRMRAELLRPNRIDLPQQVTAKNAVTLLRCFRFEQFQLAYGQ
ncbi:hypothetical protein CFM90_14985 [Ralstonia solanacearum]|nr:hypothetical protein CFM90_14985 [Ralstonia solanacearum]